MKKIITTILASVILTIPNIALAKTNKSNENLNNYYVVFDCGSSGTRIFLYEKRNNLPKLIAQAKNHIQFDTYIESPTYTVQDNIIGLLNKISPALKKHNLHKSNLQLNILATAGMRYVPNDKQNSYYQEIRQELTNSGYNVNQIRTISGNEEALFSWIAANNLNKTLDSNKSTHGILEVGGASAQIAFATTQESGVNIYHLQTPTKTYNVYNISFLGLGKNAFYQTLTNENESNVCNAKQSNYSNCELVINKSIKKHPEMQQIQNIPSYSTTNFYGIDNLYHSKNALSKDFNPQQFCATTDDKTCATYIYINQLVKLLAPTNIQPIDKINKVKSSWTAGFAYTTINNITIINH